VSILLTLPLLCSMLLLLLELLLLPVPSVTQAIEHKKLKRSLITRAGLLAVAANKLGWLHHCDSS
jgi:hypothetical protein